MGAFWNILFTKCTQNAPIVQITHDGTQNIQQNVSNKSIIFS